MPVAKVKASGTLDVMKTEDKIDNIIRQEVGIEPYLSFPRADDSPVQWIQLLHALDQQELPGWPLLSPFPVKVQLLKCEKCSREFCSPINYRRHIRVHHRLKKLAKDSTKNRDLLGAYWDKLSVEEAKAVVSFNNVMLEEVPGSSILSALTALVQRQVFSPFPHYYLRAGGALLDIVQSNPSSFPISSQELFSILDDASEKTCLCGTAVSMQRYIFDGEAGKIGLQPKNLVACTSFLLEQKLVNAWLADKDAEALRCQKQLVEEEEAAQKRQAEILERKRQKKLRQKEHRAKEQRHGNEVEIKEDTDSTAEALAPAEASLDTYDFAKRQGSPKPQQAVGDDLQESQNPPISKPDVILKYGTNHDQRAAAIFNGSEVWRRKPKQEVDRVVLKAKVDKEPDQGKNHEVLIGSVSVTLGNCSQSEGNAVTSREDGVVKNLAKQNCFQDKPMKPDFDQSGNNQLTTVFWRPVSRHEIKDSLAVNRGGPEADAVYGNDDCHNLSGLSSLRLCSVEGRSDIGSENNSLHLEGTVELGKSRLSSHAARAFLSQRWKEAISSDHVKLVIYPNSEPPGCKKTQDSEVTTGQHSDVDKSNIHASAQNQLPATTGVTKIKPKTKPEKGTKAKYIPKQKTTT
ncbi:PREDICTED: uncharacterized protein LOC109352234 isoform X3 [Lupinus angustifolius]|uniref:uncharacterized protein LOC109352234 isoform X3 n=1 Tax=Lupinus angustifolius TaxID=3871 RepID=UPI00092F4ABF|nr:PREDICTED: uncharacterized protein LOC109352234 isoform X3 [Lupinus angustifolius]